jgi:hypothetical protein
MGRDEDPPLKKHLAAVKAVGIFVFQRKTNISVLFSCLFHVGK